MRQTRPPGNSNREDMSFHVFEAIPPVAALYAGGAETFSRVNQAKR